MLCLPGSLAVKCWDKSESWPVKCGRRDAYFQAWSIKSPCAILPLFFSSRREKTLRTERSEKHKTKKALIPAHLWEKESTSQLTWEPDLKIAKVHLDQEITIRGQGKGTNWIYWTLEQRSDRIRTGSFRKTGLSALFSKVDWEKKQNQSIQILVVRSPEREGSPSRANKEVCLNCWVQTNWGLERRQPRGKGVWII